MTINKNLTTVNYSKGRNNKAIKYLVFHYTGNNGDTAWGNTNFFKSTGRGASAHYFVDSTSIWQCVEDVNTSWHCGASKYNGPYPNNNYYGVCTNTNSIGIEMCSVVVNGKYTFTQATIDNAVWLGKYLMQKYNIPIANVIRHFDVTGKSCPEPYVNDSAAWGSFKNRLITKEEVYTVKNVEMYDVQGKKTVTVAAIEYNNENYVRLRDLEKFVTAKVVYDGAKKMPAVDLANGINTLKVQIDGKVVDLSAVNQDNTNFVGIRNLLEGLGYTVTYDAKTGLVSATSGKKVE